MSQTGLQQPLSSMHLYLRLLGYVKPYWRIFAMAVFFMILFAITQASVPALLKPLLDGTFVEKNPTYLFWAPIAVVILFVVRGLSTFLSQLGFTWVSNKVVHDLREQIFKRYLGLPSHYYDNQATGNLISKVSYDVQQLANAATEVLVTLVRDTVITAGLLVYIVYLDWKLSLTLLFLLPIIFHIITYLSKRLRRINRDMQHRYGELTQILEESIKGHKVVKIFGGQQYEFDRFSDSAKWVRSLIVKAQVASSVNIPIIETCGALIVAFIVYTSAGSGSNSLSVGGFMSFLAAFVLVLPPIKNLTKINGPLQRGLAAAESVFCLIDEQPEPDHGTGILDKVSGHIRFENVSFVYPGTEKKVLDHLDLDIPAGSTLALVGPSGGGKTTIANLVPRFYSVSSGAICIDGIDITELSLQGLRQHISYVSQDVILFNDTVAANIAYGMETKPDEQTLIAAAKAAHALEFIERLPQGFDTLIGENGVRLSGGQRQRIAIARALLKDSAILILDEATSALDNESERHVQAALESLKQNRTTLIIAHRLSTIENADRIVFLKDGRIVESGSHQELLAKQGEYSAFYQTQLNDQQDMAL